MCRSWWIYEAGAAVADELSHEWKGETDCVLEKVTQTKGGGVLSPGYEGEIGELCM